MWTRPFALMMLALAQWAFSLGMELSSVTPEAMRFWRMAQIVGFSYMPVALFVFAAHYSLHRQLVAPVERRVALYAIPTLTVLLALTSRWHSFIWHNWSYLDGTAQLLPTYGIWHDVQVVYSAGIVGLGAFLIGVSLLQTGKYQRWQKLSVMLGAVTLALWYLFQALGVNVLVQPTTLAFFLLVTVAILVWILQNQRGLEIVPSARQATFEYTADGVFVLNNRHEIVDVNRAALAIAQVTSQQLLGRQFDEVFPEWRGPWIQSRDGHTQTTELFLNTKSTKRYFEMSVVPVADGAEQVQGWLVQLRDITGYKKTSLELDNRRKLFEKLVAVARATAEDSSLQATLQNALDVTTSLTGAEYGSLFLLDNEGRVTHSILARGVTAPGSRRRIVGTVMNKGVAGWVVRNRATALIRDTEDDPRWVTFPDQPYIARSVLVVPITSGSDVPGVLTLQHSEPGHFDHEDEALLRAASDQMALALHKAQLFDEQRQLAARQRTLYETLQRLGRHLHPETVLKVASKTIAEMTGWGRVGILMPDAQGFLLKLVAGSGNLEEREGETISLANSPIGLLLAGQDARIHQDVVFDQPGNGEPLVERAMIVPLRQAEKWIGWLFVEMPEEGAFEASDVQLAESLAESVTLATTNANLFQLIANEHRRLEALIESSRDGIILVSNERQILFLNRKALTLLGMSGEPTAWLKRSLIELFSSLDEIGAPVLQAAESEIRRAEQGDLDMGEGEIEVKNRALRWQNIPVESESTMIGRLIVLEDITKERALQRLRDDLTHTMVHDLRNPLNNVAGSLVLMEELLEDAGVARVAQLLHIADHNTRRMLQMVDDILSISRLENGTIPLNREKVELKPLVNEVLNGQVPLAKEKGLHLEASIGGTNGYAAPPIYADAEIVSRVLQNLVGNAIKFAPTQGNISVRSEIIEGQGVLAVSVEDDGPGIPPELSEQIFEKFVVGSLPEKGSGLGLSFCRMAVEAHGGDIWVESEPGHGAKFYFTLPLAE